MPASESPAASASVSESVSASVSESVASPSPSPAGDESSGVPAWLWWLLGLLVVAVAVATPLVLRARRRSAWLSAFGAQTTEATWFARDLLPEMQASGSAEGVRGAWSVASPRVAVLESELARLAATAPDQATTTDATRLLDAVRSANAEVSTVAASAPPDLATRLGAAAARIEGALGPPPPPTAPPGAPTG